MSEAEYALLVETTRDQKMEAEFRQLRREQEKERRELEQMRRRMEKAVEAKLAGLKGGGG